MKSIYFALFLSFNAMAEESWMDKPPTFKEVTAAVWVNNVGHSLDLRNLDEESKRIKTIVKISDQVSCVGTLDRIGDYQTGFIFRRDFKSQNADCSHLNGVSLYHMKNDLLHICDKDSGGQCAVYKRSSK
jgi:hypothetical protein